MAILNDSKYGISAYEGQLRLSLHKGGLRPDYIHGDRGLHYCEYGPAAPTRAVSRPRTSSRPAYAFNYKPVQVAGVREIPSLISADKPNLVIETLKACEDSENAFIARVYEAEGGFTHGKLSLSFAPRLWSSPICWKKLRRPSRPAIPWN